MEGIVHLSWIRILSSQEENPTEETKRSPVHLMRCTSIPRFYLMHIIQLVLVVVVVVVVVVCLFVCLFVVVVVVAAAAAAAAVFLFTIYKLILSYPHTANSLEFL